MTERRSNGTHMGIEQAGGDWGRRRVLITGIGGFVASHLARSLAAQGASVVGVLRDSRGARRLRLLGITDAVDIVHGSIEDYALMERALAEYEVEYVFHLAAQAIVGIANSSPLSTFESNIRGTWTLLEAARHAGVRSVLVASSDKAYGDQPVLPYTEETPLNAAYPYDVSKLCAEVIARSYARTFDLRLGIVRCANLYGEADLNWSRIVPGTIRSMLAGEEPIIRSDGTLERDYIHVSDAVLAYLTLADKIGSHEELSGEAFNFGAGRAYSVIELVETILRQGQSPLRPRVLGQNRGEINRQWLDSTKAQRLLGWAPAMTLDDGIRRTLDWYAAYLESSDGRNGRRDAESAHDPTLTVAGE
jgi:CDP-glucose 4,6-dehydratase